MSFIDLGKLEEKEPVPGYKVRFVHTDNMTLAYWLVTAGAALPEHSHPHEQVVNLIDGVFELTVDGEARKLEPGTVVTLGSNVPHAGKAITECKIIDAFYPVREDYR